MGDYERIEAIDRAAARYREYDLEVEQERGRASNEEVRRSEDQRRVEEQRKAEDREYDREAEPEREYVDEYDEFRGRNINVFA
ncbi:MAG TPA: hypothetical protein ENN41_02720 [Sediminispirochaeta sp.]|nr:hypothetical protein [Sediminispirochaeta sp.]